MKEMIKKGDYVRHKNPLINGGRLICVNDINEDQTQLQCSYFFGKEEIDKLEWFSISDFIL